MTRRPLPQHLAPSDTFARRHLGQEDGDLASMLATVGVESLDALIDETIPAQIRSQAPLDVGRPRGERGLLDELSGMLGRNRVLKSWIGMGYHGCIVPPVVQRNVLENPGWYTAYTPYQAEISQGRLEALLNFQTVVADLTGLPLANASLLDEATAAAEAMAMALAHKKRGGERFLVADTCHPQTIAVVQTRARVLGLTVDVVSLDAIEPTDDVFGVLVQYPDTYGAIHDHAALAERAHAVGALLICAADPLALCVLRPPGEFGADVAIGSMQRFGVPMGYGGPHAAYLATKESLKRLLPGRVIGLSKDANGGPALRMALQTREQHIRRDRATSNICTAQVLLAIMSSFYAVYHGPEGLERIAERVRSWTDVLARGLEGLGFGVADGPRFDTLRVQAPGKADEIARRAVEQGVNLRPIDADSVGVSLDETTTIADVETLLAIFGEGRDAGLDSLIDAAVAALPDPHARTSSYLTHPVFSSYHTEHEMLRYLHRLEQRDLSLTTSMIPLGSCTMKLNATSEMLPVSWPATANMHPFVPLDQAQGYAALFESLERALCDVTGFAAVSLQPNAGSQGEYAGLLVIRAWHESRGDTGRNVCLIPTSAHGTNPASAVMAGMRVVAVACDERGNIDVDDLRAKADQHADSLAALMVTYPSTHGVFEASIREICEVVHERGGQVYLDGANMNAQVGLCRPGEYGADVCHLNLHKTFCIPHGGGGPGMGPIGVASHLAPFLPGHPQVACGGEQSIGAIAAAPWGSPSILPISWTYIYAMGSEGLTQATRIAILNANYMAARLAPHFPILYTGESGKCAHEFILDLRPFEKSAGVTGEDVAKRLMDYGFHAPTMSFPVPGTLMVEPTESESKAELDRFCDALISIRGEIRAIEEGRAGREDNPLVHAPHTAAAIASSTWNHGYSREEAAFPAPWTREHKYWPAVARVDNGYGDRHLICTCPPLEVLAEETTPAPPEPVGAG